MGTIAQRVNDLAKRHGVAYEKTRGDALADVITRLSDDELEQDDICDLLLALLRKGVISKAEWVDMLHSYLTEKYQGKAPGDCKD